MTIRIYPSQIEGQPLETHSHKNVTIKKWLESNVKGFSIDRPQPIIIKVGGIEISPEYWHRVKIKPNADVRIYPVPYGVEAGVIAMWVSLAVSVVSLIYSLTLDTSGPGSRDQGDKINTNTAKANAVKLYDPVPQILGRSIVYPQYIGQPVTRFVDRREMRTSMALCIGTGTYSIEPGSLKIGDTGFPVFGGDVSYNIYQPGQSVDADRRFDNWYVCGEVGGTDAGTAGLDLQSSTPTEAALSGDSVSLVNTSLRALGFGSEIPDGWGPGTIISGLFPDSFEVSRSGSYDVISGSFTELTPYVGMPVTLNTNGADFYLNVVNYTPAVAPVPGTGGSPSKIESSGAPSSYDFTISPVSFDISFNSITRNVSLNQNYFNMSGLLSAISTQISATGLIAIDSSGIIVITEPSSPYSGEVISATYLPVEVFGSSPAIVTGSASSGGTPGSLASIRLDMPGSIPFSGLPLGTNRMAISYGSGATKYEIQSITGSLIYVSRLNPDGSIDSSWLGFSERNIVDFSVTSTEGVSLNWIGPFEATPSSELTSVIEVDIFMPGGLARYSSNGNARPYAIDVVVQWRASQSASWNNVVYPFVDATPDAIGFTRTIILPYPMRPQVRMRRSVPPQGSSYRDQILWYSLRSKINPRPDSYDGVTTMGLTVRTGDRLGAQSSRSINLIANRSYPEHNSRSIEGAVLTVTDSLGIPRSDVDTAQLEMLQDTFWTPRGETFDFIFDKQSTTRDVLRTIFGAGMGYPILSGGLISCGREGLQNPKGMLTPGEMTNNLEVSFQAPTADDFSGVDVEYMSGASWTKEVVQCRLSGLAPLKIEKVSIDGVTNEDRAWRIGMRRLRKHVGQRLTFSCDTEMDSWVYDYMDRIVLADDIPNTTMSASIIGITYSGTEAVLDIDESIDVNAANPRVMIRRNDGSVTPLYTPRIINEQLIAVPIAMIDFDLRTDLSIEYARILFGDSTRVGYDAIIESISPSGDYRNTLTALQYSADYYADDDNLPSN